MTNVAQLPVKTADPQLAALAAVFSPPLTVDQMWNLAKYEEAFGRMARALVDATWAASQ